MPKVIKPSVKKSSPSQKNSKEILMKRIRFKARTYKEHKSNWSNCKDCSLHETRTHVVFARGTLPCDILFIGEAPGVSEDTIGKPFIGPAGKLFDQIIEDSISTVPSTKTYGTVTYAITNLVSCIPIGDEGEKTKEPTQKSINACSSKLEELISIAKPRAIICVGKLSEKYLSLNDRYAATVTHPAAILRADISNRDLLIQRAITTIRDVVEELTIPF